jgi:hypothetical protein
VKRQAKNSNSTLIPDGVYPAVLVAVHQFTNTYGPRLGFEFSLGGGAAGQLIMRSTTPRLSPKSKLAEIIHGLTGREIDATDLKRDLDVEILVGTQCQVLIGQCQSRHGQKYSNILQVFKATD